MSQMITPDQIQLLLPALRHVAEMTRGGITITRADLELLLMPSDLDELWAIDELTRWAKVLAAVNGDTHPSKKEIAQRALMLRGVPEAPAVLAVATVSGSSAPPQDIHTLPINVSAGRLDFGTLPPNQSTWLEFQVSGGPGMIACSSPAVRVVPDRFGPDTTRIDVEVTAAASGLIWAELSLQAGTESAQVTIFAQCQEPNSLQTPKLSPDETAQTTVNPGTRTVPAILNTLPTTGLSAIPTVTRPSSTPSAEFTVDLTPQIQMTFVVISAGKFLFGSRTDDDDAYQDEKPQRTIHLPRYAIGKYPVTFEQFLAYPGARDKLVAFALHRSAPTDHPVTGLTWRDAQDFCRWASSQSKIIIRLPSEEEWEKAARGTDGRIWPWGNQAPDPARCNFENHVGATAPVNRYSAGISPFGVWDMTGNVWEWCNNERETRVLRGGAWDSPWRLIRAACRLEHLPVDPERTVGFRCACDLTAGL